MNNRQCGIVCVGDFFVYVIKVQTMDELVRFFHGGMVKENGEFENMIEDVELFDSSPSFNDLVDRVVLKHSCGIDMYESI